LQSRLRPPALPHSSGTPENNADRDGGQDGICAANSGELMLTPRVMLAMLAASAMACGAVVERENQGGKNDDKTMPPPPMADAGVDAPVVIGLVGLGQKCELTNKGADCPSTAPICGKLTGATTSYCSPRCLAAGAGTGANGGFTNISPAGDDAVCAAQYMATVGAARCDVVSSWQPPDSPIIVGKQYSIDMTCRIVCGPNNTCPMTMTAVVNRFGCHCVPN
jgi:hypothetical protein